MVQPDGQHVPVTVTTLDSVVRLGPFASCTSFAFDPSGGFLSLVEYDYPWSRLWLVDITSETARCPLFAPSGFIRSFGFGPGGDSVYFVAAGLQAAGPYEGQSGWWVGAVSADADEPVTVAFIPYEREVPPPVEGDDQDNQPMITASVCGDGSAILIQDELGLPSANVRVALPSGEVTRHTVGRWSSSYSADGWWAISRRNLVDVRADREVVLEPPCEWLMGYSPDGSLALGWEVADEDIPAAQNPYPLAAIGFRLYDHTGKVAYHLSAPGGGDRRISNRDVEPRREVFGLCGRNLRVPLHPAGTLGVDPGHRRPQ